MYKFLQAGIRPYHDEDESRRIAIFNAMIVFAQLSNFCFIGLYLIISYYEILPICSASVACFMILYVLNYFGYVGVSRFLLITLVNLLILVSCQAVGNGVRFEQFYICIAICPIIIYPFSQKKEIAFSGLMSIAFSIMTPFVPDLLPPSLVPMEPMSADQSALMNLVITPTVIALTFIFPACIYFLAEKDFTDLMRAKESEVENSRMAALGQMAAGIAHEINNPLSIIGGRAEQLNMISGRIDGSEKKFVSDAASSIEKHTDRITRIVSSLRTFARQRQGDPYHRVKMIHLVNETLELCQQKLKSNHVKLDIEISDGIELVCDAAQIMQVLVNLVSNAADAIQEQHGESGGKIEISASCIESQVRLIVRDNGTGIPKHMLQSITEPFFTTKVVGHGTGLGLSISKGILDDHGASMVVESPASGGAMFILLFDNDKAFSKSTIVANQAS